MRRIFLFLTSVLLVLTGYALYRGGPGERSAVEVGQALPSFRLPLLDQSGAAGTAQLRGRVTLLNVWATWCPTCKAEQAYLLKLARQGVPIVGVNYRDDPRAAENWLHRAGNPYWFVLEDAEGTAGLEAEGAPETWLIDAHGIVRFRRVGVVDSRIWQHRLKPLYDKYRHLAQRHR